MTESVVEETEPTGESRSDGADDLREAIKLIQAIEKKKSENRLRDYKPYPFQMDFHNCKDINGEYAYQKFLQAANQVGKTLCTGAEVAMHATGIYPVWYEGHKLKKPTKIIVAGVTNDTTRDICQGELLGDPEDEDSLGTGTIPRDRIVETFRKVGIPNAYESAIIRHIDGHKVTIKFKSYETGYKKFMGSRTDLVWLDEEPPPDIWSQVQRSQFSRPDSLVLASFTPEEGATQLVNQINDELQAGQGFVNATWWDAPHICDIEGRIEYLLGKLQPYEREMRSRGIPSMGSGLIFPILDERIMIDPIPIPDHWKRLNGMDFGWDHPAAVAFGAWDEEADIVYIYAEYSQSHALPPMVASAIKGKGEWIPNVWPHDGMGLDDKAKDKTKAQLLIDEGVNMHDTWFTNPPADGEKEGSGGNSVEPGLINMLLRMESGRLKVFSTCTAFFKEKGMYHRKMKNGKPEIVKLMDDVISAVRYLIMSLRHAETEITSFPEVKRRIGARNW